jgi:hypothetical protein
MAVAVAIRRFLYEPSYVVMSKNGDIIQLKDPKNLNDIFQWALAQQMYKNENPDYKNTPKNVTHPAITKIKERIKPDEHLNKLIRVSFNQDIHGTFVLTKIPPLAERIQKKLPYVLIPTAVAVSGIVIYSGILPVEYNHLLQETGNLFSQGYSVGQSVVTELSQKSGELASVGYNFSSNILAQGATYISQAANSTLTYIQNEALKV